MPHKQVYLLYLVSSVPDLSRNTITFVKYALAHLLNALVELGYDNGDWNRHDG